MYYQVFINDAYVRDAQIYLGGKADDNAEYLMIDEGWEDVGPNILFIEREFENFNKMKEFIRELYPDMDFRALSVLEFPEKPVLMNWEGDAI